MTKEQTRYVVGIDLGTTNNALAYVDTGAEGEAADEVQVLSIAQLVNPGEVQKQQLLPSFLYLPGEHELPAGSLSLPWAPDRDYAVGALARQLGERIPRRMVASAKSWLCHRGVDRTAPILPWASEDDVVKVSPLEATTRYLLHLKEAWNRQVAQELDEHRLEVQEVYLTVPASFDAVARDLTAQAAKAAGLENVTLLEEPQSAFYSWLQLQGDGWRNQVSVGDAILVCDIGGGTTDFTLIAVDEEDGNLTLERLAVGDHILVGGDNMDLALAYLVSEKFKAQGQRLDSGQVLCLWHTCRAAKERVLADPDCDRLPVAVVGRGSRLVGGTLQTDLTREEVLQVILDGFFAECKVSDQPAAQRASGLQELGLDYACDPVVPKHIAKFLSENVGAVKGSAKRGGKFLHPTAVLFNGGVTKSMPVQERIVGILNGWLKAAKGEPVRVLEGADLDLAAARGGAYYGLVRRGKGIRIRGGTARTYYVGVETARPAVPGMAPPIKALCVVPFGMEEGTEVDLPKQDFGLIVGQPAQFRFLSSVQRKEDVVGTIIDDWELEGLEELAPLEAVLPAEGTEEGTAVPVRLRAKVTEVGALELWCVARDGEGEWKLEFNVREKE